MKPTIALNDLKNSYVALDMHSHCAVTRRYLIFSLAKPIRSIAALVSCYCLIVIVTVNALGLGALFLLFVVLFPLKSIEPLV